MDREKIEQELRDHFVADVKEVEPSREWWNNRISRLGEQKHRSRWFRLMPKTRLAWAILPLIILLAGGTVYGAGSLIKELFQKHVPQIEQAGLAQEMDLSQTINGITVSLERAYADSNVVLVGFTVIGPDARYHPEVGELSTADGQNLPGMIGVGFAPGSNAILGNWNSSELAMIYTFDTSSLKEAPSELSLILEADVADLPIVGESQTLAGPFRFEFDVPFHAGKIIDIGQTVEAAGVPVTLEQVVISPWGARAVLQLEPNDDRYIPIVSMTIPSGDSAGAIFGKSSVKYFTGDFTRQPGEWTIIVSELVSVTQQRLAGDTQQRLAGPWVFHFEVP